MPNARRFTNKFGSAAPKVKVPVGCSVIELSCCGRPQLGIKARGKISDRIKATRSAAALIVTRSLPIMAGLAQAVSKRRAAKL